MISNDDKKIHNSNLKINGYFYKTYKAANPSFDTLTFKCAETTISQLLSISTTSEHPGMLLGKVQSGKTRAFITILALAFDNSYDIAVVLSKNSKALIEQTTKRLASEFSKFLDEGELEIYDIMHASDVYRKSHLEARHIFVAKKQKDNLSRLISLLDKNKAAIADKRILIIDDEADNASIGYSKNKDTSEIDANTIARLISDLRTYSKKISFLQVTATPYSLYLQPESVEVANVDGFKPTRPAFTVLVPVPETYVGGDTYFGEMAKVSEPTVASLIHQLIDHKEFDRLKTKDLRSVKLTDLLTTNGVKGYRTAIINFIVGGCMQRVNAEQQGLSRKKLKYSFLLHSDAAKGSHEWQEEITQTLISQFKDCAVKNTELFEQLVKNAYDGLKLSLELNRDSVPLLVDVVKEVKKSLEDEYIDIEKVNSDEDVASKLDSSGQLKLRSIFNIFIGGQVLDRGVTLANLIGFYYGRRPSKYQQDTVLQHSRMYGYRKPYLGITRFYTSSIIRDAMFKMEEFDSALRGTIEKGGNQSIQFIHKDNAGKITPCSPNKILISNTQTLKPGTRILPIGFQSGYRTHISKIIESLDLEIQKLCGFNSKMPVKTSLEKAISLLKKIESTLVEDEESLPFNWEVAYTTLEYLAKLKSKENEHPTVWVWAAKDRDIGRKVAETSHTYNNFNENPDSKTEASLAVKYALDQPILFLLRQNGTEQQGWRDTPFYWPVIRAQTSTPVSIYAIDTCE